jgi:hypothetical protein
MDVTEYFTHIEENIYNCFEWRKSSPETMDMFKTMFYRIKHFFSVEEFDKLMRLFDCYDPFGSWEDGVVWRILKLIRYAHWNQYYFANMSDDDLRNLCEQYIKLFKNELEIKLLEKDFT